MFGIHIYAVISNDVKCIGDKHLNAIQLLRKKIVCLKDKPIICERISMLHSRVELRRSYTSCGIRNCIELFIFTTVSEYI